MNGSYEVHCAMLIIVLWQVNLLIMPILPEEDIREETEMDPGTLTRLATVTHAYMMVIRYMTTSPRFSNGALLQIANFVGLGLYIFFISKVAIEIYDS